MQRRQRQGHCVVKKTGDEQLVGGQSVHLLPDPVVLFLSVLAALSAVLETTVCVKNGVFGR